MKNREEEGIDGNVEMRFITDITLENFSYCMQILKFGELRHISNFKGAVAISESEFLATVVLKEQSSRMPQLIYSNVLELVEQQQLFFDSMWESAMPAEIRMREIKEGTVAGSKIFEVIKNPIRALEKYKEMIKSARNEIIVLFPTPNAVERQTNAGILLLLKEAQFKRNVKVRILSPYESLFSDSGGATPNSTATITRNNNNTIATTTAAAAHADSNNERDPNNSVSRTKRTQNSLEIRYITQQQSEGPKSTIITVDRTSSLTMELLDDSKSSFNDAIGISIFSKSKASVSSNLFIFESLWMLAEVIDELRSANHKLKVLDKIKDEFISTASHELKQPIQPIIGLVDLATKGLIDEQTAWTKIQMYAKRLQLLSKDILDISRIENNDFIYNFQQVSIKEVIDQVIESMRLGNKLIANNSDGSSGDDNILFETVFPSSSSLFSSFSSSSDADQDILQVRADKERLIQVFTNIIANAINAIKKGETSGGKIIIEANTSKNKKNVIILISDTGHGIPSDILPKLFGKFVTKSVENRSSSGTGLGLYISRKIIQAHDGTIYASNNLNGGATFAIVLPLLSATAATTSWPGDRKGKRLEEDPYYYFHEK